MHQSTVGLDLLISDKPDIERDALVAAFAQGGMIFARLESSCARSCASAVLALSEQIAAAHASRKRIQGSIPTRAASSLENLTVERLGELQMPRTRVCVGRFCIATL